MATDTFKVGPHRSLELLYVIIALLRTGSVNISLQTSRTPRSAPQHSHVEGDKLGERHVKSYQPVSFR